ncbi:unnamed protein product [Rotaria sp. Silwood2]|nr:unnamed protein product [Rotaria sp. Silwood2]CAF4043551.1 unnamed protein product [Rotaria sp. Silwood2]
MLLHLFVATPQINLYYTDYVTENESESNNVLKYNCLRLATSIDKASVNREIISYCTNELASKFHIENNDVFPKFTFVELSKRNITSQQLCIWPAPIDIVERYQFYLNQISTLNDKAVETQVFYNCTLPRFVSMCQYEIISYNQNYLSLYEIIHDYYRTYEYKSTNFTCYTHLQCNRGPSPACLDWSEICDGQIDCLDGDFDEEHCWQLEMNECNDNEYRCTNGQCILQSFFRDDINTPDCFDNSDEVPKSVAELKKCNSAIPSFECQEKTCRNTFLTKSCEEERKNLLLKTIYSTKDNAISEQCWSAFKCLLEVPGSEKLFCSKICEKLVCVEIINRTCPDMFYMPNVPFFLIKFILYMQKNDSLFLVSRSIPTFYICYNNSHYDALSINHPKLLFNNKTCFRPQGLPSV